MQYIESIYLILYNALKINIESTIIQNIRLKLKQLRKEIFNKRKHFFIVKMKHKGSALKLKKANDENHVIENFLEFIEKSVTNEPQSITPASESRYNYYRKLAKGEN